MSLIRVTHLALSVLTLLCLIPFPLATSFRIGAERSSLPCGSCTCDSALVSANCSWHGLTSYPSDLPNTVLHLNLAGNEIEVSRQLRLCQQYPQLTKLSLAWNKLRDLPIGIFQGCSQLRELDLTGNVLEIVNPSTFGDLDSLEEILSLETQIIHRGSFNNLKKLQSLNLTVLGIQIPAGVFHGLSALRNLSLTLDKVSAPPSQLFSFQGDNNLKYLTFKGSKVKDMTDDLLDQLTYLQELHLEFPVLMRFNLKTKSKPRYLKVVEISSVMSLAEDTLFGLKYLDTVRLYGIDHLPEGGLFGTANAVKTLEIVGCSLVEVPAVWLSSLALLENLNLSHNDLESIQPLETLSNLTSLKLLDVSNNKIKNLPREFLISLNRTLTKLFLSHNNLVKLGPETILNLGHLEILDLRKNKLTGVDATSFKNLPKLKKLLLSGNYISSLDRLPFTAFPMLEEVDLSDNLLSQIPETVLSSRVSHLNLAGNLFRNLAGEKLCHVGRQLEHLMLNDNPITCDCSLRALHKCRPQLEVTGVCSKPNELAGKKIGELSECELAVIASNVWMASSAISSEPSSLASDEMNGGMTSSILQLMPSVAPFSLSLPTSLTPISSAPIVADLATTSYLINDTVLVSSLFPNMEAKPSLHPVMSSLFPNMEEKSSLHPVMSSFFPNMEEKSSLHPVMSSLFSNIEAKPSLHPVASSQSTPVESVLFDSTIAAILSSPSSLGVVLTEFLTLADRLNTDLATSSVSREFTHSEITATRMSHMLSISAPVTSSDGNTGPSLTTRELFSSPTQPVRRLDSSLSLVTSPPPVIAWSSMQAVSPAQILTSSSTIGASLIASNTVTGFSLQDLFKNANEDEIVRALVDTGLTRTSLEVQTTTSEAINQVTTPLLFPTLLNATLLQSTTFDLLVIDSALLDEAALNSSLPSSKLSDVTTVEPTPLVSPSLSISPLKPPTLPRPLQGRQRLFADGVNPSKNQSSNGTAAPDVEHILATSTKEWEWFMGEFGHIVLLLIITISVVGGVVSGFMMYRKYFRTGTYNPISMNSEASSDGNIIQMEPVVQPMQQPSQAMSKTSKM